RRLCFALPKPWLTKRLRLSLGLLPTTTSGEPRRLRLTMQPKHWLDPLLALNASSIHELMGSFLQQLSGRPEIELQPNVDPLGGRGGLPPRPLSETATRFF